MRKHNSTSASTHDTTPKVTILSSSQTINKVFDHFHSDLEPQLYKLSLLNDLLLYADFQDMSIQDSWGDVSCGLNEMLFDAIEAIRAFHDNIAQIYREISDTRSFKS